MTAPRIGLIGAAAMPLVAARGDLDVGSILGYVVVGAVVGAIGRLLISGTGGMSWLLTIVVGIVGAVIGGWLAGAVWEDTAGVDWISSILVATILVWIVARSSAGRRRVY